MKFPSIKNLFQNLAVVLKRFPFEMLFALCGTIAAITYTELHDIKPQAETWCLRIIMTANLGLLLSLAATLYGESSGMEKRKFLFFRLIAAIAGASLIFIINPFVHEADYIRFFLVSLALHLLVAFAAFIGNKNLLDFWRFNAYLFFRFLTSMLYSIVLFLGIAAAIGAVNFLFNFKFESDAFAILAICIIGLFNTIFFLAGMPDNYKAPESSFVYPIGLKIFTQYVLIPLATVYVVILLAYELKILIEWNLPKGLVSNLILSYAVFGILSLLLVFPVREQAENKWIKTYARSFYFLMLPLIVLLFLAVGTRISRYGVTEYRYFLILLACWLLLVTLYFLLSRKQNIKLIPISLCLLTLLSVYGPQSAFNVAMYSQRARFIDIFKRNHAFNNGKLSPVDSTKITHKDGNKAVEAMEYLVNHYDITCLQPYLNKDLTLLNDSIAKLKSEYYKGLPIDKHELRQKKTAWLQHYLNLDRFSAYGGDDMLADARDSYSFRSKEAVVVKITGYDFMMSHNGNGIDTVTAINGNINIQAVAKNDTLYTIHLNDETVVFRLKPFINNLVNDSLKLKPYADTTAGRMGFSYELPQELLNINAQTKSYKITLRLSNLEFHTDKQKVFDPGQYLLVNASYLIKVK